MKIKIPKSGTASELDINTIQNYNNRELPIEYKLFLKKHDRAVLEQNIFPVDESINSGVHQFINAKDILKTLKQLELDRKELIPFSYDDCGNYILIDISSNGRIVFLDHETNKYYNIADSFTEFLEILEPDSSDDVELKPGQVISTWIDPDFLKELNS